MFTLLENTATEFRAETDPRLLKEPESLFDALCTLRSLSSDPTSDAKAFVELSGRGLT